ncbi:hypothetical protein CCAX7_65690 [Capsulimonas corticalis]|uniref:Glycosyltransferase 2-like domain-containing protein n=1 Tax=Capsulimonas corticalis TaxID=2219043 RepID=A0A402CR42_9BACT|nr:glycosyltransferase [Capsulimonas corticalis]BDI34518.1 hypothetical protein CCAX7_65690 [Capsulimonas corticalis]
MIDTTASPAPLVSVIIATYNRSATLRWTIESVLRQTCADFELLVIGDACMDDTAEVVASFGDPRIRWINLPVNTGSQSGPNSEGLRRARGRYIAYLGHDDLWFPWRLSGMTEALESSGDDFVHGLVALLAPEGVRGVAGKPPEGQAYGTFNAPPSGWLHRRSIVDVIGYWADPASLSRPIDVEYLGRAYKAGLKVRHLPALSVLKWPSAWWRAYALTEGYPQAHFAALMSSDPKAAYDEVMQGIAIRLAEDWDPRVPVRVSARRLALSLQHVVGQSPLWSRWPLSDVARWRAQQFRRRSRRDRGLGSPSQ